MTESNYSPELLKRAAGIKLILMDVDGVMTDGKLYYFPDAKGQMVEFKGFNSHDGLGLHLCHHFGILTGIISGRVSPATVERAKILKMKYVYQGKMEKVASFEEILKDSGLKAEETAFIGDDFPDAPLLKRAGLAVAPENARAEIRKQVHFVAPSAGGAGAVRDAVELVLKAKGLWSEALKLHELPSP